MIIFDYTASQKVLGGATFFDSHCILPSRCAT